MIRMRTSLDYENRHVVVTGGTGALGGAVLSALLDAGAMCHVPYRSAEALGRCPHRENSRVSFAVVGDLADEAAVMRYYEGVAAALGINPSCRRIHGCADCAE